MHIPVLQKEVLEYLDPKPGENFIDATVDGGGHSAALLEKILPGGQILGIDQDPEMLEVVKLKIKLVCGNFADLKEIVQKCKFGTTNGILFDLGLSSWHLEQSKRGFSFQKREPLNMRYNLQNQLTAEKIVNFWSRFEIERILREYGEERFASQIARTIVEARRVKPINNTLQLAEIVRKIVRGRQKIHPATRTFQALRIAVNDELNNLEKALPQTLEILKPGGRLAIISFHSLEDRIVKNFLRDKAKEGVLQILTKKPVTPSEKEIKSNPRSRSAKLRAALKI